MSDAIEPRQQDRVLVLVTGSGRSGTSSLAGSLLKLGLHVPTPLLPAKEINPKGFFETAWVVHFHNDLLREAIVRSSDGSPRAQERVDSVLADGRAADELATWLSAQAEPRLVVKDNQACWFLDLWREVSRECGLDLRLLTSLRHPAEVVGSRDLVWGEGRDDEERRLRETANVAAWLNGVLLTEHAGRTLPRAFTSYVGLLDDWRSTLGVAFQQLGVDITLPPPGTPHELDEWLDADLQHSRLTWQDIRVPEPLQELAAETWDQVNALRDHPQDPAATATLDGLREEWVELFGQSAAIATDHGRFLARAAARRQASKFRAQIRELRGQPASGTDGPDDAPERSRPWGRRFWARSS